MHLGASLAALAKGTFPNLLTVAVELVSEEAQVLLQALETPQYNVCCTVWHMEAATPPGFFPWKMEMLCCEQHHRARLRFGLFDFTQILFSLLSERGSAPGTGTVYFLHALGGSGVGGLTT